MKKMTMGSMIFLALLTGCAHLEFGDEGLTYYEPKPYLFVTTTKDCVSKAEVIVLPAVKKSVKFISGYGTAKLSLNLSNGMITSVGQDTDTQVPATISAITGLTTAAAAFEKGVEKPGVKECTPTATLYPIVSGDVENTPFSFRVK